jgi:four helix bundle protein
LKRLAREEEGMRDFRKLTVWQRAHELALDIYAVTRHFPKEEIYGLTQQMRRSAGSIPTNISEGCGRDSLSEFAHFLHIASGSSSELEYQLLLSKDLGYLPPDKFGALTRKVHEVRRMLAGLLRKLKADS